MLTFLSSNEACDYIIFKFKLAMFLAELK